MYTLLILNAFPATLVRFTFFIRFPLNPGVLPHSYKPNMNGRWHTRSLAGLPDLQWVSDRKSDRRFQSSQRKKEILLASRIEHHWKWILVGRYLQNAQRTSWKCNLLVWVHFINLFCGFVCILGCRLWSWYWSNFAHAQIIVLFWGRCSCQVTADDHFSQPIFTTEAGLQWTVVEKIENEKTASVRSNSQQLMQYFSAAKYFSITTGRWDTILGMLHFKQD